MSPGCLGWTAAGAIAIGGGGAGTGAWDGAGALRGEVKCVTGLASRDLHDVTSYNNAWDILYVNAIPNVIYIKTACGKTRQKPMLAYT